MFDVTQMISSLIANKATPGQGVQLVSPGPVQGQTQSQSQSTISYRPGGGGQQMPPAQFTAPPPEGLPPEMARDLARAQGNLQGVQQRASGAGGKWATGLIARHRDLPEAQAAYEAEAMRAGKYLEDKRQQEATALADDVFNMASAMNVPRDQAKQMAQRAMRDPEYGREVQKAYLQHQGVLDERGHLKTEEVKGEGERRAALMEFGIPMDAATQLARDEGLSVEAAVKLWYEQIDRGNEDIEQQWAALKAQNQQRFAVDNTIKQITNTMENARGFGALGLMGAILDAVPNTPAYNTASLLDTQRAALAFKELFDMRQASKTGGALGNVSNREIELLYSAWSRLDPKTGDQFISNLTDVLQRYERLKWMLDNEEKMLEQLKKGELTQQEFFDMATEATNMATAKHMGVPKAAMDYLKENPDTVDAFQTKYGWSPISNVMQ